MLSDNMLTERQQGLAAPSTLALPKWIVLAKILEQLTLHVPPSELPLGMIRTHCLSLAFSGEEASFLVVQRPALRNDLSRNCITVNRVRCVLREIQHVLTG